MLIKNIQGYGLSLGILLSFVGVDLSVIINLKKEIQMNSKILVITVGLFISSVCFGVPYFGAQPRTRFAQPIEQQEEAFAPDESFADESLSYEESAQKAQEAAKVFPHSKAVQIRHLLDQIKNIKRTIGEKAEILQLMSTEEKRQRIINEIDNLYSRMFHFEDELKKIE